MKAPYLLARNILPLEDAHAICQYISHNKHLMGENGNPRFNERNINPAQIEDVAILESFSRVARRVRNTMRAYFDEPNIHIETSYLNYWPVGMDLGLHADNTYYPSLEPNYVWWRTYSAVVYLNGDYTGGEFYFLDGEVIRPSTGDALMFGGGMPYVHGVRPVLSGVRYTIPIWCTDDKNRVHPQMKTDYFTRETIA